jgi:hypothetical protein
MTIRTTIIALETLRNVARMVPVFGPTLEGVAEILIQGCRFAQVNTMIWKIIVA